MIRILFICHGNICRSAAAEMILTQMAKERGILKRLTIDSAATSTEEIGNDVYPPMKRALHAHGIRCLPHSARQITRRDYDEYDLLIGMDRENLRNMRRLWPDDPDGKLHTMMEYAGRPGAQVADPWYTRDFEATIRDVTEGCEGLIASLGL